MIHNPSHTKHAFVVFPVLAAILFLASESASGLERKTVAEQEAPPEFTAIEFPGHADQAETLSKYLWYHFHHRMGNIITLFNKEYLALADLWLNGALDRASGRPIQDLFREFMRDAEMDAEGYVSCHQHISHAHDLGWPFPLWTQSHTSPEEVMKRTMGWHFQSDFPPHWVGNYLRAWNLTDFHGDSAVNAFELENAESLGIVDACWRIRATGPSPSIATRAPLHIQAFDAPFLQLRWRSEGDVDTASPPYVEWTREGDADFSEARRVYLYPQRTPLSDGFMHSHITMHRHPQWTGTITAMRLNLAPGKEEGVFELDSFFTAYDTRHTINNPILIIASYHYFNWTRDLGFLRENINRMRMVLRYQQTEMGGLERNHIRVHFQGHDGGPGWVNTDDGEKIIHSGTGMGNNYWDLLPFGWDDFYATMQYYASTVLMGTLEEAIRANPGWDIPLGALAFEPDELLAHAQAVKAEANDRFWNPDTGRFRPSITREGRYFDHGLTFVNLEAIWYGIANDAHTDSILDWIRGKRIVAGDTSTGEDIYHWRFGPRATTKRNVEWYKFVWTHPEHIPWGGQVQDGGAVLGFTFYDLWARLHHVSPDDAWNRLLEILDWQREVDDAGGYRAYYGETDRGTTLQGGGTAGGLGIDFEFFESSLLPAIVPLGFMGIAPTPAGLHIRPRMPEACPEMRVRNLLYSNLRLDITASAAAIEITVKDAPVQTLRLLLEEAWTSPDIQRDEEHFAIRKAGSYRFILEQPEDAGL